MQVLVIIESFGDGWRWQVSPEDDLDAIDAGVAQTLPKVFNDLTECLSLRVCEENPGKR